MKERDGPWRIIKHTITCKSGRRLLLCVPALDTELPVVEQTYQLHSLVNPPTLTMEVVSDDGGSTETSREEELEAVTYLETNKLIPDGLADALRDNINNGHGENN